MMDKLEMLEARAEGKRKGRIIASFLHLLKMLNFYPKISIVDIIFITGVDEVKIISLIGIISYGDYKAIEIFIERKILGGIVLDLEEQKEVKILFEKLVEKFPLI